MIEGKILRGKDNLSEVHDLRKEVFCHEQGIEESDEFDELDCISFHAVAIVNEHTIATARLSIHNFYKIGRVAVKKEYRGKGYGNFVVRLLLMYAFEHGAEEVRVGAQKHAVLFYKKIGFIECGEQYLEANIEHIPMVIKKNNVIKKCK